MQKNKSLQDESHQLNELPFSVAKPGDICVLIRPAESEIPRIRRKQVYLQARFGGRVYQDIHATCQRFDLSDGIDLSSVVLHLQSELSQIRVYQINANSLIQFFSPFWQTNLLRWCINETREWFRFKLAVENAIISSGCKPHYPIDKATSLTALESESEFRLDTNGTILHPQYLFTVYQVVLTEINKRGEFKTLGYIDLP